MSSGGQGYVSAVRVGEARRGKGRGGVDEAGSEGGWKALFVCKGELLLEGRMVNSQGLKLDLRFLQ